MVVLRLHVERGEKRAAIFTFEKNEKLVIFCHVQQHQDGRFFAKLKIELLS